MVCQDCHWAWVEYGFMGLAVFLLVWQQALAAMVLLVTLVVYFVCLLWNKELVLVGGWCLVEPEAEVAVNLGDAAQWSKLYISQCQGVLAW